jgi:hypothetical protein
MSYRELRRSDLLDALFALEREEDINRCGDHGYVFYHKQLSCNWDAAVGDIPGALLVCI